MIVITILVVVVVSILTIAQVRFRFYREEEALWERLSQLIPRTHKELGKSTTSEDQSSNKDSIKSIIALADHHEAARTLVDLIALDGAGSWPARANHDHTTWPGPLRPYREIFEELQPLLPEAEPSQDDEANRERIDNFRHVLREALAKRVGLQQVMDLFDAAEKGDWDVFPRDVYNAFYSVIATCRHAYRWAMIPAVRVTQLEQTLDLPPELDKPWTRMQAHFGVQSGASNLTALVINNFGTDGSCALRPTRGLPDVITRTETAFASIMRDVEAMGVPAYHSMILAMLSFTAGDGPQCAQHVADVAQYTAHISKHFSSTLHNDVVAHSAWLPYVQGFHAWGLHRVDGQTGERIQDDGLSGNQVLFFMMLDAFLGFEPYLDEAQMQAAMPRRQREAVDVFARGCFRGRLEELGDEQAEGKIGGELEGIVRRLRIFRATHRRRVKVYLGQPAPERLPMSAGKSLLKQDMETSIEFLDGFMVKRIGQTR